MNLTAHHNVPPEDAEPLSLKVALCQSILYRYPRLLMSRLISSNRVGVSSFKCKPGNEDQKRAFVANGRPSLSVVVNTTCFPFKSCSASFETINSERSSCWPLAVDAGFKPLEGIDLQGIPDIRLCWVTINIGGLTQ